MTTGRVSERPEAGTWLLATLAGGTLLLARSETATSQIALVTTTLLAAGAPLLALELGRRRARFLFHWDQLLPFVVALWTFSVFPIDFVLRAIGQGDALEIVLLAALQNASLALAAYSHRRRPRQVSVLLASFLVLFAVVIASAPRVMGCAALFGVAALWWMMARYWERISQAHVARTVERCLPVRVSWFTATLAAIGLAVAVLWGTTSRATHALRGFLPTSGGDRWSDPAARAGIGDGDAMVAAEENAQSFGPVESDLFLESKMPSLYDVASEVYGRPPKPNEQRHRTIALESGNVKHPKGRTSRTQRSGKEFSTVRKRGDTPGGPLANRDAPALLYVIGRVPLHLAMETFDTYDGWEWSQTEDLGGGSPLTLRNEGRPAKPWVYLQQPGSSRLHRGVTPHALKIINFKSRRIPSPPQLAAVHIDLVDREDFFGRTRDGQLEMTGREHIPQLTVLHVRSCDIDLDPLRAVDFSQHLPDDAQLPDRHLAIPYPSASELARQWTTGIPRGWRQVEAIVERLRSDFTHDPQATIPTDTPSPVEHFLRHRRGPDYMFATTAAVLLRHQGYATRLVSGFYVHPNRYDRRAGQTTVLPEDLHTWVEVRVDHRQWVPIEPTPGYAIPRETWNWRQHLAHAALTAWKQARRHPWLLLGVTTSSVLAWLARRRLLDAAATYACRAAGRGSATSRVRWTIQLLEWRGRLWGLRRPETTPLGRWYRGLSHRLTDAPARDLLEFMSVAERVLYGPTDSLNLDSPNAARLCGSVEAHLSASWLLATRDELRRVDSGPTR